ncbi:MAG: hypothetical protein WKF75_02185 [Singulisphaera sp.]
MKQKLSASGSSLTLNATDVSGETISLGSTNLAAVTRSSATITPKLTGSTGAVSGWTTQATSKSQSIKYTVTGLVPNATYKITKKGSSLTAIKANSAGALELLQRRRFDLRGRLHPDPGLITAMGQQAPRRVIVTAGRSSLGRHLARALLGPTPSSGLFMPARGA